MYKKKEHLREALLFCFNLKKSTAENHRLLVKTMGSMLYLKQLAQIDLEDLKNNDFNVNDKERIGQLKKFENEE